MNDLIIVGQISVGDGLLHYRNALGVVDEVEWLPPLGYLRTQPVEVPLLMGHDETWPIGQVRALLRNKRELVMSASARADMADLLGDGDWFLSPRVSTVSITPLRCEHALLREVSVVRHPANCQTSRLRWARADTVLHPVTPTLLWDQAFQRGCEALNASSYTRPEPLTIDDIDPLDVIDEWQTDPDAARARATAEASKARAAIPAPKTRAAAAPEPDRVYRRHTGQVTSYH